MSNSQQSSTGKNTRQGWDAPLNTDEQRHAAIEAAFDYRGDVTIHTSDGRRLEGYIFDRRNEADPPYVRMMTKDGDEQVSIPYERMTRVVFSDRDPAAGKSWETWVKKYAEKKVRGESPSM